MLTFAEKAEKVLFFTTGNHESREHSLEQSDEKSAFQKKWLRNYPQGDTGSVGYDFSPLLSSPSQALPSTCFHLRPLALSLSVEGNQFALPRVIAQCGIFGVRQCLWTQTTVCHQAFSHWALWEPTITELHTVYRLQDVGYTMMRQLKLSWCI